MSRLTAKKAASTAAAEAKTAREMIVPHLMTARDAMAPALGHAREAVGPALGQAREAVLPALEQARQKVEETLRDEVLPRVAAGYAATEPARDEALRRGAAAIAALRGELDPPKPKASRRVGKLLVVAAVGAAAFAAWKAWKLPHDSEDWVHTDGFSSEPVPGTEGTGADAAADKAAGDQNAAANGRAGTPAGQR